MNPPSPALSRLSAALGLGDDPRSILADIVALYDEVDREVAAAAAGHGLPCHAGCDACCYESVFLSAPEFLAVAAHLLETRQAFEIAALVGEMSRIAARFADELELLESIPAGAERDEVAARVKFRCPLLDEAGTCSVYPVRELNGRTFGQSWDGLRQHAFGCTLTHERLRVLPLRPALFDAREARRRLRERLPGTERVHVYPWWFARFGAYLTAS